MLRVYLDYLVDNMSFDPILIILQISSLQCFYYLAMGTLWGIMHVLFSSPVSLDHFFTAKYVNFITLNGWVESVSVILCSVIGAYLLSAIVERSKKCVDFTFTLYFLHICICIFYFQFPLVWEWWLVQVISSVIMATLGEYLCARNELQDIPSFSTYISDALSDSVL